LLISMLLELGRACHDLMSRSGYIAADRDEL
jgi:hypothetical protein